MPRWNIYCHILTENIQRKQVKLLLQMPFFASENKSPEINAIVQLNLDGTLKNYTIVGYLS